MRIQEYLICAIQNIQALISYVCKPTGSVVAMALKIGNFPINRAARMNAQRMISVLMINSHGVGNQVALCMAGATI